MSEIIYENNSGDKFIILDQKSIKRKNGKSTHTLVLIKFLETSSTRWVYKENVSSGKVKDYYKPSRYGIGYSGDCDKSLPYFQQGQQLWANMLKRCYTDDPKGYKKWGTTVDPRWHCLKNFLEDLPKLDNFNGWLKQKQTGVAFNLDKDLKVKGCNVYSLHTCSFVLESVNKSEGAKTTVLSYYRTLYKD